jgi:hypothetical protein|eukprot:g7283.t1
MFSLRVVRQPPVNIRTRTPKEKRHFKLVVRVFAPPKHTVKLAVKATLLYADKNGNRTPEVTSGSKKQGVLIGGALRQELSSVKKIAASQGTDGGFHDVTFADLNLYEPSSRHKDREFCFRFDLVDSLSGSVLATEESSPTYAYTHPKVLRRRREVCLRAVSGLADMPLSALLRRGPSKQNRMHVVGGPFIASPRLGAVFCFVGHGSKRGGKVVRYEKRAENIELFSESALFFDPPKSTEAFLKQHRIVDVEIRVTNDSRHFSNSMTVTYKGGDTGQSTEPAKRAAQEGAATEETREPTVAPPPAAARVFPNDWYAPVAAALGSVAVENNDNVYSLDFMSETDSADGLAGKLSDDSSCDLGAEYDGKGQVLGEDFLFGWNGVDCLTDHSWDFDTAFLGNRVRSRSDANLVPDQPTKRLRSRM